MDHDSRYDLWAEARRQARFALMMAGAGLAASLLFAGAVLLLWHWGVIEELPVLPRL